MSIESYMVGQVRYKIILVGDAAAGKTSIFWRYIKNEEPVDHLVTTIDFRYKNIEIQDKKVKLCIWDTAGQEKFRCIVATYFKSCDGVILVFDLSNPKSWESIKTVWHEMATKRVPNACFMLFGTKKDLGVEVDLAEVNGWCLAKGIYFIQTSAKTGQSIDQAFFTLAALIDCQKSSKPSVMSSFATSYTSTQYTFGEERRQKSQKYEPKGVSFYLKPSQKMNKDKNCCK